ncbi:D-alanine--D-alanine ligase [Candidatus Peregrinibacteria bacterium]|nr:D-alanine--D-alanine ligase [Candidatus Peregrinibacteria bacterium]
MNKINIGVIFGGRSGEHEVSLVSATSVIGALNPEKYEIVEIGITQNGKWYTGNGCLESFKQQDYSGLQQIFLSTDPKMRGFVNDKGDFYNIDIFFPVLHGPFGEDGTIQGLFEIMNIPYVGCGVLASSTAMDKLQCKSLWESAGLPVVPYIGFNRNAWEIKKDIIFEDIEKNIGFPCFVKPANMGSSVGITKVKKKADLLNAIDFAASFDRRILVEKAINGREIECSVIGNNDPVAAPVGEVIVGGEFYDFYDKYVNGVSMTQVPADIPDKTAEKIKEICIKAYKLLDCGGLSRVDSFLDRDSGEVYLNEINTMPGFTSISMYPKMIEAHGISYEELVDKLVDLGFERFEDKSKNKVIFDSGSEWYKE